MKNISIILPFVVLADSAHAETFTNSVSADSFVRASAPTLNYGGAGALSVSGPNSVNGSGATNGVFDSFMRFNTAAMVTHFNSRFGSNNWAVSGVKLRVTELGAPANTLFNRGKGAFEIRWIAGDNWIEGTGAPAAPTTNGIAYNDEPTLLNSGTDASLGTFTNAGIDVTESFPLALPTAFTSDLKAGGEAGLFLTAIGPGIAFTFDSRSFMTNSARPFLEISAVPPPGHVEAVLSGTDLVITGTNGVAGVAYVLLTSTNAALSPGLWQPVATNSPVVGGQFTFTVTNAAAAGAPAQQLFIVQSR